MKSYIHLASLITARFDWDDGNRQKCQKHGVSIKEIEGLFQASPFVGRDEAHSAAEDRYVAVGRSSVGRAVLVIFTLRSLLGEQRIRPVSALHAPQGSSLVR